MKLALFDTRATLDGAQRSLLDFARGLLRRQWEVVAVLGTDGPLGEALRHLGLAVLIEPLPPRMSSAPPALWRPRVWAYAWRLRRRLQQEQVDLLYANTMLAAYLGGLAMYPRGRALWRLPHPVETPPAQLRLLCSSLLWQIHVPFAFTRDALRLLVGDRTRIEVVPHGITGVASAPVTRKPGEPPVIGMCATWAPRHGQEVLARAFRLLQDGGQRAHLRLAGEAASVEQQRFRSMVLSAIRAAGLDDRLHVDDYAADLPALYAGCDVVVIPALYGAHVRQALEAGAAGRPVVATRVCGLAEVVEDGHTGLLVPPNHPRALADALALLLASPALRAEMGRQARIRVEERFSLDAMLTAFETALGQRPGG